MSTRAPIIASPLLWLLWLLPPLGALADAVFNFLRPTVYVDQSNVRADIPAGLHLFTDVQAAITDPTFAERALTALPMLFVAVLAAAPAALRFLDRNGELKLEPGSRRKAAFNGVIVSASVSLLGMIGAIHYAFHYFRDLPYGGWPGVVGVMFPSALAVTYMLLMVHQENKVKELKSDLAGVV